ncbi:transmembrane protein 17-like [Liolophura sinensis]|uniref:transmembrane protein 17-like n=1 Tax=Liolophura sinensis TaxID=3198878 RepID=UPI0031592B1A
MDVTLRRAVTSVTDRVFPVSKASQDPQKHHILRSGNDYVTNLPLQMSLYFNTCFAPFWIITSIVLFEAKFDTLPILYKIILTAIYVIYSILEVIRLYLGYLGNLTERVPELAGCWLLTLLIQLPLILFLLLNEDTNILPLERAVHIVELLFVLFEAFTGYFAIRIMVNYQVTRFHLQQFSDLEQLPEHYTHVQDVHYR